MLFDFDGPICSVFDGYPAPQITLELLALARQVCGDLEPVLEQATGPHGLLLAAAGDPRLAGQLEAALQKAELTAIGTARPTAGAAESIAACVASGRLVGVVSNNYAGAITAYLIRAGLSESVAHVEGRDPVDPTLMKPILTSSREPSARSALLRLHAYSSAIRRPMWMPVAQPAYGRSAMPISPARSKRSARPVPT